MRIGSLQPAPRAQTVSEAARGPHQPMASEEHHHAGERRMEEVLPSPQLLAHYKARVGEDPSGTRPTKAPKACISSLTPHTTRTRRSQPSLRSSGRSCCAPSRAAPCRPTSSTAWSGRRASAPTRSGSCSRCGARSLVRLGGRAVPPSPSEASGRRTSAARAPVRILRPHTAPPHPSPLPPRPPGPQRLAAVPVRGAPAAAGPAGRERRAAPPGARGPPPHAAPPVRRGAPGAGRHAARRRAAARGDRGGGSCREAQAAGRRRRRRRRRGRQERRDADRVPAGVQRGRTGAQDRGHAGPAQRTGPRQGGSFGTAASGGRWGRGGKSPRLLLHRSPYPLRPAP